MKIVWKKIKVFRGFVEAGNKSNIRGEFTVDLEETPHGFCHCLTKNGWFSRVLDYMLTVFSLTLITISMKGKRNFFDDIL